MKALSFWILFLLLFAGMEMEVYSQVKIQGTGNTSATHTLITTNSTPDTTVFVRDDGNVGIGTVNPTTKLDVNGWINAGQGIQYPDGTTQTTATASVNYANVFTVATSGGDFNLISNALAACVMPGPNNRYLIRVMPGIYFEPGGVVCQEYVDLRGSGKYSCVINGTVMGADSCVIENFFITQGIMCMGTSPFILHNIITRNDIDNADGIYIQDARPWVKENEILDCVAWGINNVATMGSPSWGDGWFIANKILRNGLGGIRCENSSPTISNNLLDSNHHHGIFLTGMLDKPAEPTIDDNVIGHTDYAMGGIGIYMIDYCEPRIMQNDIYLNECGIWIDPFTQPSIIGNNIAYNYEVGIRCFSTGAGKRVVITSNHIHSNATANGFQTAGIWIQDCDPIISNNNITQNDRTAGGTLPDIDYSASTMPPVPTISLNVFDIINTSAAAPAGGIYNSDSAGNNNNP